MLELKNIKKSYKVKNQSYTIFNDFSLTLPNTGLVFISGRSGLGKTTLLNLIAGIENIDEGQIILNGVILNELNDKELTIYRNKEIGLIYQDYNLFENLSIYDNITVLKSNNISKERIDSLLKKLNIYDLKDKKIKNLSGGEQQRVAILRALIKDPNIILCDEITSSVDEKISIEILDLLKELSKEKLIIVVSHDIDLINKYADITINLEDKNNIRKIDIEDKKIKPKEINNFNNKMLFKFANMFFKENKKKFIYSTLLIILVLVSFFTSFALKNMTSSKVYANTMIKEKNNIVKFDLPFNRTDKYLSNIKSKINNSDKLQIGKSFWTEEENHRNNPFYFDLTNNGIENIYYNSTKCFSNKGYEKINITFYEINEYTFENQEYIGVIPTKENEIMISEYLAELLVYHGFINYGEPVKLNSYEELFNLDSLDLNGIDVKITGIVKQDLKRFDNLKNLNCNDVDYNTINLFLGNSTLIYNNVYITKDFLNLIDKKYKEDFEAYILEDNKTNLIKIFNNFSLFDGRAHDYITSITSFAYSISELLENIEFISLVFKYVNVVVAIILILILMYFIQNNIFSHRKEISILKSLGIYTKDIKKILLLENIYMIIFSYILSIIITFIAFTISNHYIEKTLLFKYHPLILYLNNILVSFIILVILIIIISILLSKNIKKFKPSDILKKG